MNHSEQNKKSRALAISIFYGTETESFSFVFPEN